ncbi:hypothetical protein ZIOFF_058784 [Zingiber officinale]|uniref:Protein kinase domain-containing protein n=2 Tax=Zingiber officinale TaxID=94328 RepID=A0A8J5FA79_ZINOF|nr:hypothetical protein ZIOFF_058784 [Zingiber officinale]
MLKVYAENKLLAKGKELVNQMSASGCRIGPLTWDAIVKLYIDSGEVEKADSILHKVLLQKKIRPFFSSFMAVMDQYAKRGDIHNTEKIFRRLKEMGYVGRMKQYEALLQAYVTAKTLVYGFRDRMKADNMGSNDLNSTDPTAKCSYQTASPLISLEYSNRWDPMTDERSSIGSSQEAPQIYRFNLEEIECATQYFSEVNLLSKKSSFAATYKGILRDGTEVAVKRINKTSCKLEEAEFLMGLKALTLLRHENLVGLRGFCYSRARGECFLIYDFVANGSLSKYLDVKCDEIHKVLDWSVRVCIIKGIAKGMEYLHSDKPSKPSLLHQNMSSTKVLIDHHFNPLLSSSALHKLLADDAIFSSLKTSAAMGYLAPEYSTN